MNIPIEKHIDFYNQEIASVLDKWENYLGKQMKILISEKELFIGRLWAYEDKSGLFIIRFKSTEVPRTNTPYFIGFLGNGAVGDPSNWIFTYKEFRESEKIDYWSRIGGEVNIVNYWKTDENWSFLIVNVVDLKLHDFLLREYIEKGVQPLLAVAEIDPPIDYLINLRDYLETNSNEEILNLDIDNAPTSWKPINIDNTLAVFEKLLAKIESNKITIIQGPPGTGKSYIAAEICDYFIAKNRSIALCALTNKALMEIVRQPPLKESLNKGLIFKTALSKEESILQPKLELIEEFTPKQGELLLTTYYKLSGFYKTLRKEVNRFDLLIIEEASQAFLATLSMFSQIPQKILIIGDHKQLPPIVVASEKKLLDIHPKIYSLVNGLETLVYNDVYRCYRLKKTRRLTTSSAQLTGLFYDNQLESISPLNNVVSNDEYPEHVFNRNCGISIARLSIAGTKSISEELLFKSIIFITTELLTRNSYITISILVSTVYLEKQITLAFSKTKLDHKRIVISTVHKVQGLTCDYTFYYMPLTNVFFELNDNLFNVATSRAKKGCFILTYRHLNLVEGISNDVSNFLKGCDDVTNEFYEITSKITI